MNAKKKVKKYNAIIIGTVTALTLIWAGCGGGDNGVGNNGDGGGKPSIKTFVDERDGKKYKYMKVYTDSALIGDLVCNTWMAENLNYDIPDDTTDVCYENKEENCKKYGRLYSWEAAQRACPEGWRLPSHKEWKNLVEFYTGTAPWAYPKSPVKEPISNCAAAEKLISSEYGGTDNYGFSALPGGGYVNGYGNFSGPGGGSSWWTATEDSINTENAAWRVNSGGCMDVDRNYDKKMRFSVRCNEERF